jgi:capsular polysaccharide biosynthesis protein
MFASTGNSSITSIVSRATEPVRAASPNVLKLLVLSLFASIFLGFGGPLAYELLFRRLVRSSDDVERGLGVPVLAQFGPLDRASGSS